MSAYQQEMQRLLASGWTPDQGIPESLIEATNQDQAGSVQVGAAAAPASGQAPGMAPALGGAGTMDDPMQLSTMMVQGDPMGGEQMGPPEAGAGTGAGSGVFAGMDDMDADKYAEMGDLKRQMTQAEALRDTGDAEGKHINQGRTFVAASPLEHISVGVRRWKGAKDAKKIGGKQTEGRRSFIDLLRNKKTTKDLTPEEIAEGEGWDEEEY